jgi:hypothetical protein
VRRLYAGGHRVNIMDTIELSNVTAGPIQVVGMSFYFDPHTVELAGERGLHRFQFYGLGRGGVLGDVDRDVVDGAFTFFNPAVFEFIWDGARLKADPVPTASAYLQAAYQFADRTFGAIPTEVLARYAAAAHKVARAVESGHHLLVDGYRQYPVPENAVHAAYLGAILMRELRGCVHIDAVRSVGLTPLEACYLQDPNVFKAHGYKDDEVPAVTADHEKKKAEAEVITSTLMADCFAVLSDDERQYLRDGALAMFDAVRDPVAVTE